MQKTKRPFSGQAPIPTPTNAYFFVLGYGSCLLVRPPPPQRGPLPALRMFERHTRTHILMAQSTNSIGNFNKLLGIRDQLSSRQVDAIKQHLLSNEPLPPTFFSDIEDLRYHRSHDLLTSQEHADMLNAHVNKYVKNTQASTPAESHGAASEPAGQKRKAVSTQQHPRRKGGPLKAHSKSPTPSPRAAGNR